jgi:paraquat-inducible protein A
MAVTVISISIWSGARVYSLNLVSPKAANAMPAHFSMRNARVLLILLMLATGLLVAGLILPMLTITKLLMFRHSFSVLTGVYELWQNGHVLLFVVVAGFSIVVPFVKIAVLFKLVLHRGHHSQSFDRLLHLMHEYGRWAMLDVMVVAVLIMTVKLGAIASIEVHSGLFVFGLSVLLIMFVTRWVVRLRPDPLKQT